MEKLTVAVPGGFYEVSFGRGIWEKIKELGKTYSKVLVVSDSNVARFYGGRLPFPHYVLKGGEQGKTLSQAQALWGEMEKLALDRRALVVALGGGVVGDLAGFAASLYLRGLPFVQIPTTLLAQVDSCVGGKTGVNTPGGKNLLGTFHQPQAVFVDPAFLKTLPPREIKSGLGEVLKYGIIADPQLFFFVLENLEAFWQIRLGVLGPLIRRCLELKSRLIAQDERDFGERRILNFGHTLGHALEARTAFQKYSHGEAVLAGMLGEARLALELGLLSRGSFQEIKEGLQKIPLAWDLEGLWAADLLEVILRDKKNQGGQLVFLLPEKLGVMREVLLSPGEFATLWRRLSL